MRRWLPNPGLSLLVLATWCALAGSLSVNSLVFGAILGAIIPLAVAPFWPESLSIRSLPRAASYAMLVLWDICVANVVVARIVLFMPVRDLRPAWVTVPLRLTNPEAIIILSGTITMTPGTLTADLAADGRSLLVHCLHAPDPDAVRDDIINRYEARLLEFMQ
ncbi:Na+/H+ antiporter subunit E [Paracoccus suum]|uniref:Na+/H+ antiporter subunit E n=1 Tax=Paracoccus suum TaxID=2259340 RepID=A0A344PLV2_9RHOB|nr:Na+/H+ antiporter subunit E [Paracoccus suum]AXC50357.1 Na+/H+ antiporter subunit E [Paracoccus suum]